MECRKGRRKGILSSLLFVWLLTSGCTVAARSMERYDTAYACESKTLRIECQEGDLIHLIRANYGRFSITICNEHGNTDWSVNCMSQKSFRVLYNKCNQQQNCSIVASTSQFGDPCPNTLKYLEAHYQCVSASTTTTTSRPSPPWLITSQPSVWSTVKATVRPPSRITTPAAQQPPQHSVPSTTPSITTLPSPTSTRLGSDVKVDDNEDLVRPVSDFESVEVPVEPETTQATTTSMFVSMRTSRRTTVPSTQYPESSSNGQWYDYGRQLCLPREARNLIWNTTRAGDMAVQNCPGGANGYARWNCVARGDSAASWDRDTPDLSECRSVWLTSLENRIAEGDVILGISRDLSQVTNNSQMLYGGDMKITTKIIQNMAKKLAEDIKTYQDASQREVSVTELLQGVIRTGSNLLDEAQLASWRDLSENDQMAVATSLFIGLEENAFLLAETLRHERKIIQEGKNILMEVRVLETRNINNNVEVFPSKSTQQKWNASIQLPRRALIENSEGGIVRLVFMAFDRLEEILQTVEKVPTVVMSDDQILVKPKENRTRILNSKVISASLGKGRHIELSESVKIYFRHLTVADNISNPTCVFWDYTVNAWSNEGCNVLDTNTTHTVCTCRHLTNFAILMDVHAVKLTHDQDRALQIMTYIGCTISVVCLFLAILTFQLFRGLKSDRTTIHKNLCVCLLVAEILFVCGIGQTDQRILCGIVAGLLHFFFLCAFAWMFLEGFQLYVMLIEVFEAEKSRLRWYYLVAYGLPLVIVAVSCIIDPLSYGTEQHCWLRTDNYFIFSFVGPVILVILANLVFLSMAIYMMCRHANTTVSMKSKEHSRLASARAWLRGAVVLVFLLGLTWTFGLLYLNQSTIVMAYIFTILNSLQGLFIFLFHCVQNEKVKKEYRKFIRRHSWLPKCLRCSKTVTGSSGGSSGTSGVGAGANGGKDFGSHNTSSNPSAPTTDSSGLSPHAASNNISFKSYSRDSGHGGSEQEESPRTHGSMTLQGYSGRTRERRTGNGGVDDLVGSRTTGRRAASPYNHTYTEIRDGRAGGGHHQLHGHHHHGQHMLLARGLVGEDDPVYEEIERGGEIQVSDMSDEDGRRQSDMSRQSSRSYGDHRPLIPYSPANDRNNLNHYGQTQGDRNNIAHYDPSEYSPAQERSLNACWEKIRRQQARYELGELPRLPGTYGISPQDHTRTVAVLDGHTVVCHLQPQTDMYTGRGIPPPSYSEC